MGYLILGEGKGVEVSMESLAKIGESKLLRLRFNRIKSLQLVIVES
jgi:hypothetical protein